MIRKSIFGLFSLLSFIILLFNFNCGINNTTEETPVSTEVPITTITSTTSGSLNTSSGFGVVVIPGAVPPNSSGAAASVAFSIEAPTTSPKTPQSFMSIKGSIAKFGPEGFIFNWPVRIIIPYTQGTDPSTLKIIHYNALQDTWVPVPISSVDLTSYKVSADVLELGYYALATFASSFLKPDVQDSDGGFEFNGETDYYNTLTVKSVSSYKYAYQAAWYQNPIGMTASTGSKATGGPNQPTHFILPQATYEIWVSKTQPGTLSQLPKTWTYTLPATGTISQPLSYTQLTTSGWTILTLPSGGSWAEGRPNNWPTSTKTYGTGEFQATLTWTNISSRMTDLDLHLYGPNDIHVYWDYKTSDDGSFQLDRDWTDALAGNAVENIYSLKTIPKGSYKVTVLLYFGSPTSYNVRIIRSGSATNYTGSVSTVKQENTIATFTY